MLPRLPSDASAIAEDAHAVLRREPHLLGLALLEAKGGGSFRSSLDASVTVERHLVARGVGVQGLNCRLCHGVVIVRGRLCKPRDHPFGVVRWDAP